MPLNVFPDVLSIKGDHPGLAARTMEVIDHAQSTAFAATLQAPPKFAFTTGAGDDGTTLGMIVEELLKLTIFIIGAVAWKCFREERRLDEPEDF